MIRTSALLASLLLLATVLQLGAAADPVYTCDPSVCKVEDGCHCASIDIPGGLAASETPQFVVLTWDDSILPEVMPKVEAVTHHKSANGCPLRSTFFCSTQFTYFDLAHDLWANGHEIAAHTDTHVTTWTSTKAELQGEILAGRLSLSRMGNIPEEQIRGFRAPGLQYGKEMFTVLRENGFAYDSSIAEYGTKGATWASLLSPEPGRKIWPYSMDNGIGQHCDSQANQQAAEEWCPDWRNAAGLWEVPLWSMDTISEWPSAISIMDNVDYDVLRGNFDARYNGNRVPFGIFLHPIRTDIEKLNTFLDYAAAQPNVYFVTMSQLLAWMENPKSVTEMAEFMPASCDMAGAGPSFASPQADCPAVSTPCKIDGETVHVCGNARCPSTKPSAATFQPALCDLPLPAAGSDDVCAGSCHDYVPQGAAGAPDCSPRDCEVSDWSEWVCDAACEGEGTATRSRTILVQPRRSGKACPSLLAESKSCLGDPCNRNCTVSAWSDWSDCSGTCGEGLSTRTRTVVEEALGSGVCPEADLLQESQTCTLPEVCPVDCVVSEWTDFSACPAACGESAIQTRTRQIVTQPEGAGTACPDTLEQVVACQGDPCPIDCVVGAWASWSTCSAQCGIGERHRSRAATTEAAHGGAECAPLVQMETCYAAGCVDGLAPTQGASAVLTIHIEGVAPEELQEGTSGHTAYVATVAAVTQAEELRIGVDSVQASRLRRRLARAQLQLRGASSASRLLAPAAESAVTTRLLSSTSGAGPSVGEMASLVADAAADGIFLTTLHAKGLTAATRVYMAGSWSLQTADLVNDAPEGSSSGSGAAANGGEGNGAAQATGAGVSAGSLPGDEGAPSGTLLLIIIVGGAVLVAAIVLTVCCVVCRRKKRKKQQQQQFQRVHSRAVMPSGGTPKPDTPGTSLDVEHAGFAPDAPRPSNASSEATETKLQVSSAEDGSDGWMAAPPSAARPGSSASSRSHSSRGSSRLVVGGAIAGTSARRTSAPSSSSSWSRPGTAASRPGSRSSARSSGGGAAAAAAATAAQQASASASAAPQRRRNSALDALPPLDIAGVQETTTSGMSSDSDNDNQPETPMAGASRINLLMRPARSQRAVSKDSGEEEVRQPSLLLGGL